MAMPASLKAVAMLKVAAERDAVACVRLLSVAVARVDKLAAELLAKTIAPERLVSELFCTSSSVEIEARLERLVTCSVLIEAALEARLLTRVETEAMELA